jgi:hypothetical protein
MGQEDHEFHATLVLKGYKLQPIPQSLLYYRMHSGDQMNKQTDMVSNQLRSIRPYSEAVEFQDVVRIIANRNLYFGRSLACNETITGVSPKLIPNTGAIITLAGEGILCAGVQSVTVGGQPCDSITVLSELSLTCAAPAVVKGADNVVVTVTFTTGTEVQQTLRYYIFVNPT